MDRYIARQSVASAGTKPGHNKWDFDYSLRTLKADYVVANFHGPISPMEAQELAQGDWGFTGAIYFNPTFATNYYPYPLQWNTWRTLYAAKTNAQKK